MNPKKHTSGLFSLMPALLLSAWYLFAVCGIDIHRDAEHGQVFVVPGIVGCDCEIIHPGQHCFDTTSDTDCLDDEDCCTDFFTVVQALGEEPEAGAGFPPAPASILFAALHPQSASAQAAACPGGRWGNAPPPPEPYFSKLGVLRI